MIIMIINYHYHDHWSSEFWCYDDFRSPSSFDCSSWDGSTRMAKRSKRTRRRRTSRTTRRRSRAQSCTMRCPQSNWRWLEWFELVTETDIRGQSRWARTNTEQILPARPPMRLTARFCLLYHLPFCLGCSDCGLQLMRELVLSICQVTSAQSSAEKTQEDIISKPLSRMEAISLHLRDRSPPARCPRWFFCWCSMLPSSPSLRSPPPLLVIINWQSTNSGETFS